MYTHMKKSNILKFLILTSSICSGFIIQIPQLSGIKNKRININTRINSIKMEQKENKLPVWWSKDK